MNGSWRRGDFGNDGAGFADYEDAVLHESARAAKADGIVTRNRKDFDAANLTVFDPPELLALLLASER